MRRPKNTGTAFSERNPPRIRLARKVAISASEEGTLEPIWCSTVTMVLACGSGVVVKHAAVFAR